MPKDYVTPNVNDDLQDRLRSITQQILSRTRLLHIIDQLHLYADSHGRLTADDKVDRMRRDIDIELVRDGEGRVSAFNVLLLVARSVHRTAGNQRTDQPVHQRESGSPPTAIGRHHEFSRDANSRLPAKPSLPRSKRFGSSKAST